MSERIEALRRRKARRVMGAVCLAGGALVVGVLGTAGAAATPTGLAWLSAAQGRALAHDLSEWSEYYATCAIEYSVEALGPNLGDARRVTVRRLSPQDPRLLHPTTGQSLQTDLRPIAGGRLVVNGIALPLVQAANGEWSATVTPSLVRWFLPNSFALRVDDPAGLAICTVEMQMQP
ncbi:MAG: hypothetical protein RIT40_2145 [Planctomycetota bacterium]|jgi:hypothetical protein